MSNTPSRTRAERLGPVPAALFWIERMAHSRAPRTDPSRQAAGGQVPLAYVRVLVAKLAERPVAHCLFWTESIPLMRARRRCVHQSLRSGGPEGS
jgi:hypothetical protein